MLTNLFETDSITGLTRCYVRSRRDLPLGPVRILTYYQSPCPICTAHAVCVNQHRYNHHHLMEEERRKYKNIINKREREIKSIISIT